MSKTQAQYELEAEMRAQIARQALLEQEQRRSAALAQRWHALDGQYKSAEQAYRSGITTLDDSVLRNVPTEHSALTLYNESLSNFLLEAENELVRLRGKAQAALLRTEFPSLQLRAVHGSSAGTPMAAPTASARSDAIDSAERILQRFMELAPEPDALSEVTAYALDVAQADTDEQLTRRIEALRKISSRVTQDHRRRVSHQQEQRHMRLQIISVLEAHRGEPAADAVLGDLDHPDAELSSGDVERAATLAMELTAADLGRREAEVAASILETVLMEEGYAVGDHFVADVLSPEGAVAGLGGRQGGLGAAFVLLSDGRLGFEPVAVRPENYTESQRQELCDELISVAQVAGQRIGRLNVTRRVPGGYFPLESVTAEMIPTPPEHRPRKVTAKVTKKRTTTTPQERAL